MKVKVSVIGGEVHAEVPDADDEVVRFILDEVKRFIREADGLTGEFEVEIDGLPVAVEDNATGETRTVVIRPD